MTFDTVNAVVLAIAFFMPGFIMSSVLATSFRRRSRSAADLTLQYLTFSCVNYGLWSWLIILASQGDWIHVRPVLTAVLATLILFISPIALALLAAGLSRFQWVKLLLSAFGLKVQRFIPTAWDFKFEQEVPTWVIVRLKDGSTICGFFGNQSFAGDDPDERDIYIEAVFLPHDDGQWKPVPETGGILVKSSEIATVEFKRLNEVNYGE